MKTLAALVLALVMGSLAASPNAFAAPQEATTPTQEPERYAYAQLGAAAHAAHSQTVGVLLPWPGFQPRWAGGHWQGHVDIWLAHWAARRADGGPAGHARATSLGITPTLRVSPSAHARWFLDAGVGLTLSDRHYSNHRRELTTRYNFATHAGAGLWLNAEHSHALSLRVEHISNAGIKTPNPGENFLQLRYQASF